MEIGSEERVLSGPLVFLLSSTDLVKSFAAGIIIIFCLFEELFSIV